jgi:hypothetical protein
MFEEVQVFDIFWFPNSNFAGGFPKRAPGTIDLA